MSISLLHHLNRQKTQELDNADHRRHQEAVARAKSVDAALHSFDRRGPTPVTVSRSSNGIGQLIAGAYPEISREEPAQRRKVDRASLLPEVQAKTSNLTLSDNALALFDLLSRAYLAGNHRHLVDLSPGEIRHALAISDADAQAAKAELMHHDLITFQDNGSGDKGYRPRLKSHVW